MATLDVLQECPELWPLMTNALVQAAAAAAAERATNAAFAAGVAAGVAWEKARTAAAPG